MNIRGAQISQISILLRNISINKSCKKKKKIHISEIVGFIFLPREKRLRGYRHSMLIKGKQKDFAQLMSHQNYSSL